MNNSSTTKVFTKRAGLTAAAALATLLATAPLAQAEPVETSTPQTEVVVPAPADATEATDVQRPKMKIKGVVTRRDADTFTVR